MIWCKIDLTINFCKLSLCYAVKLRCPNAGIRHFRWCLMTIELVIKSSPVRPIIALPYSILGLTGSDLNINKTI